MYVLTKYSWESYEDSSTTVLATASSVKALKKYAKRFGCYPKMWEGRECITAEEVVDGSVYPQEVYLIEPIKVVQ